MSPMTRYAKKQAKARTRRRLKAQQRLQHQRAQAQLYIEALHQALIDLDFPDTLVAEIEGRLQAHHQLLGKIVGLMFPTLFGSGCPSQTDACNLESHGLSQSFPDCEPEADWKFAKFVKT